MIYKIAQLWLWFIITCIVLLAIAMLVVLFRDLPYLGVALVILGVTMWAMVICDRNPTE